MSRVQIFRYSTFTSLPHEKLFVRSCTATVQICPGTPTPPHFFPLCFTRAHLSHPLPKQEFHSIWIVGYFVFLGKYKKLAQGTKQNLGSCSEARLWLTPGAFCWEQNRDPPQTAAFLKMHWGVSPGGSRRSKCCKINLSKLDQIRPL